MRCPYCECHMDEKRDDQYIWYVCPNCGYQEIPVKIGR